MTKGISCSTGSGFGLGYHCREPSYLIPGTERGDNCRKGGISAALAKEGGAVTGVGADLVWSPSIPFTHGRGWSGKLETRMKMGNHKTLRHHEWVASLLRVSAINLNYTETNISKHLRKTMLCLHRTTRDQQFQISKRNENQEYCKLLQWFTLFMRLSNQS